MMWDEEFELRRVNVGEDVYEVGVMGIEREGWLVMVLKNDFEKGSVWEVCGWNEDDRVWGKDG